MRLATDSDRRAIGLGRVSLLDVAGDIPAPTIPYQATPIYIGTDNQFANQYWPNYSYSVQNGAPAGYSQPDVLRSGFFDSPLEWAEDNQTAVYWAVGAIAGLALLDSVM